MVEALERFLLSGWGRFFPGERPPRRLKSAVISVSREEAGTLVVMAFPEGRARPAVVARMPRLPSGTARLEREAALLSLLASSVSSAVKASIPVPLGRYQLRAMPVFVQTAVRGVNLKTLIQRGRRGLSFQLAADLWRVDRWLEELHKAWPPPVDPPGLPLLRRTGLLADVSASLAVLLEQGILSKAAVSRVLAVAEAVDKGLVATKSCFVHGDLWPGNIFMHERKLGVIDWDGLSVGNPLEDRVFFALHLGMVHHGQRLQQANMLEALRRVFFEEHPYTAAVRSYLQTVFRDRAPAGVTHRDLLLCLLAREAGAVAAGRSRGRLMDLLAVELLTTWQEGKKEVVL